MGAQKTQSFSCGMNGQNLNILVEKKFWDVPDDGVKSAPSSLIAHGLTRCMGLGRSDAPKLA